MQFSLRTRLVGLLVVCVASSEVHAQTVTATIRVGARPEAAVANPITNRIYVANHSSNTYTVISGATNNTTTITDPAAGFPVLIAAHPVTNKIYAVDFFGAIVAIDGAPNRTSIFTNPNTIDPFAIAVTPITNKVY